jgi:hypothetical protein
MNIGNTDKIYGRNFTLWGAMKILKASSINVLVGAKKILYHSHYLQTDFAVLKLLKTD